jgi:hypothetical protein
MSTWVSSIGKKYDVGDRLLLGVGLKHDVYGLVARCELYYVLGYGVRDA